MRALVVADSRFVAESIRRSLRHDDGIRVMGYLDGHKPISSEVSAAELHVAVLDEMTDATRALARVRELRAAAPEAKLVLLTSVMREAALGRLVEAGIDAALCKSLHPRGIAMLVRAICAGTVFHAFPQPRTRDVRPAPEESGLTPRELGILALVSEGASNRAIAARLGVTEQTVKFHLSNVYRKLGVTNRTQASRYLHVQPLTAPPTSVPRAA